MLLDKSLREGLDFRVIRPPAYNVIHGHEHRFVGVALRVALHHDQCNPSGPRAAKRQRVCLPAYRSAHRWAHVATALRAELGGASALHNDDATFAEGNAAFGRACRRVTDRWLRSPTHSLRSRAYRRFHGINLPELHVRALAELRAMRQSINLAARGGASPGRLARLHERYKTLQKSTRTQARRHMRERRAALARTATELRSDDPHGLHAILQSTYVSDNPLVYEGGARPPIPPSADGVPAAEHMLDHARHLYAEVRRAGSDDAAGAAAFERLCEGWAHQSHLVPVPPAAASAALNSDISADEVYRAIFPADKHQRPEPCTPGCTVCAEYLRDHDAWSEGTTCSAPQWRPCMRTSVAGGEDGIVPELIRWARPLARSERLSFRLEIAGTIARLLNKALAEGTVPVDFARAVVTPILKRGKDGAMLDARLGDSYRDIAVCGYSAKVLSTVLAARLSHWAITAGVIDPAQVGFIPAHGPEHHVFTLTETIKARLRRGEHTSVLFVDLKKAYDLVHRDTLWKVLEKMGVPQRTVSLLRNWSNLHSAVLRVNGGLTAPFDVRSGVPQGSPVSPILFNLFIESLSRHLAANFQGVHALGGIYIDRLLFADDIACLAKSKEELQTVLDAIVAWCDAWGMQIGIGGGKTEAMHFAGDRSDAAATSYRPLRCMGKDVHFVAQYKYLGLLLRHDLDMSPNTERTAETMRSVYHRWFTRNALTRQSPIRLQLQLYKSQVLGVLTYLRSIVDLTTTQHREISNLLLEHAAEITKLRAHSSNVLKWTQSRLLTLDGMIARDHERLSLQLQRTPYSSGLAARLYQALAVEQSSVHSRKGAHCNWVHAWRERRAAYVAQGAVESAPALYSDIARSAHVFGRSVSYGQARRSLQTAYPPPADDSELLRLPPRAAGSTVHTAALRFHMFPEAHALGVRAGFTPVSIGGPGCSGSLLAAASSGRYPAVAAAALGATAIHEAPFAPWREKGDISPHACRVVIPDCRLCGAEASETIFHLLCECPHDGMVAHRVRFEPALRRQLRRIWVSGTVAQRRAGGAVPPPPPRELADLRERGWQMLAYWTLLAIPWPERPCTPHLGTPGFAAAVAYGRLFDALTVPTGQLSDLAQLWLHWSESNLRRLATTWNNIIHG